jgi:Protein of unknown function (DUF3048) N-terminal domain/Protein of unknown function (DUF3048) C-terminal domain
LADITSPKSLTSFRPTRLQLTIAYALVIVVAAAGIATLVWNSPLAGVHARLDVPNSDHVRVQQPVTIRFDQNVDLSRTRVTLDPVAGFEATKQSDRLVLTPIGGWATDKRYTVLLTDVPNSTHSMTLSGWHTVFTTQIRVGIAGVLVDGKTVPDPTQATMRLTSKLAIAFTTAMKTSTVTINVNGQPLTPDKLQWAPSGDSVTLNLAPYPYQAFTVGVAQGAYSEDNDPLTDNLLASVTAQALMPSNPTSNIGPGFQTLPPIEVVVENSGPARPQVGLQDADMVYEYISEYSISRMTAIYFNKPPGLIGPVRSCRMINPFLGFAYGGETMCSGASVGTLHYMFYSPHDVPGSINDFDRGNHFFRVNFKEAPHNLYTKGDDGVRLRDEWHLPQPQYQVDPPHSDVDMGQPADAPSVPLHAVSWSYDAGSKQYLRSDHGTAFTDDQYHAQLHAKNVVVMHVGFHDAGWVEDDNGGAHSIWYDMLGSGPAEVWSDGKLVHATWHMGSGGPQWFYDNHQPVWFTDEQGKVMQLNSGLTWIHVVGNGQTS